MATYAIKNTHLLLVEDEENLRLSLSLIARKAGYRISVAADGREALRKIVENKRVDNRFDALVIDIQIPGLNGIELYSELRRQNLEIPVVIMSGYKYREVITNLNMNEDITYLEKPFLPEEFLDHIEKAIKAIPVTKVSACPDGKGGRRK